MREKKIYPTSQKASFVLGYNKKYDLNPPLCSRMLKRIRIYYMLNRFFRKKIKSRKQHYTHALQEHENQSLCHNPSSLDQDRTNDVQSNSQHKPCYPSQDCMPFVETKDTRTFPLHPSLP